MGRPWARPRGILAALLLCASLLPLDGPVAAAAKGDASRRVALVIGNGAYRSADTPKLSNPPNDADDIAAALRRFGFSVILKKNVGREAMRDAVAEFGRQAADADAALFFFAGHGVQIKSQNYLVPVDAKVRSEADLADESLGMNYVLDELDNAHSRVNIVILDACRNNPIGGKFRGGATRGLAAPSAVPKGTVIVYATDPGNTADDGEGRNGLFTAGLLTAFRQKDLSLDGVLTNASAQVERLSEGRQTPYVDGPKLLQKSFVFAAAQAGADTSPVHVPSADEIETELWNTIKESRDPTDFDNYLTQYPNGRFVALARQHAKDLRAASASTAHPAEASTSSASAPQASVPPAAPVPAPAERTVERRFAVAEKRNFSWCYGYLTIAPERVQYQVVKPQDCAQSSFDVLPSEVHAERWTVLGQPQLGIEITAAGSTRILQWLADESEVQSGPTWRLAPPRSLLPNPLLAALRGIRHKGRHSGGQAAPPPPSGGATSGYAPSVDIAAVGPPGGTGEAATAPAQTYIPALQGDGIPGAQSAGGMLDRVYVALHMPSTRVERRFLVFSPDGLVLNGLPDQGLNGVDLAGYARTVRDRSLVGRYQIIGNQVDVVWDAYPGEHESINRDDTAAEPTGLNRYVPICHCDGAAFSGVYPFEKGSTLQFLPNGTFMDRGVMDQLLLPNPYFNRPRVGSGTYAIRRNTILLSYSDGHRILKSFAAPAVDEGGATFRWIAIGMNTLREQRAQGGR